MCGGKGAGVPGGAGSVDLLRSFSFIDYSQPRTIRRWRNRSEAEKKSSRNPIEDDLTRAHSFKANFSAILPSSSSRGQYNACEIDGVVVNWKLDAVGQTCTQCKTVGLPVRVYAPDCLPDNNCTFMHFPDALFFFLNLSHRDRMEEQLCP